MAPVAPEADASAAEDVPQVSVVVTVRNAEASLPNLLADLAAQDWPPERLEVCLVDAESTDTTWDIIQAFQREAPFEVKAARKAGSIGVGRNEGFRLAEGAFVAVTDDDMRVPSGWIRELVAGMNEADIGVVGGPNNRATSDLVSRTIAAIPVHGPTLDEVPLVGGNRYRHDFTTSDFIYACVTRNSLFRREAFDAAGGFDETLVATEDPELNRRILDAGYRLRYRRAAGVQHVHRPTLRSFFRQQRNYATGQAQANATHPGMFGVKQVGPSLAAGLFVLCLLAGFLDARAWVLAGILGLGAVLLTLLYSLKVALVKRDGAILVAMPVFFVAWQLAWVVGYPRGMRRRGSTETQVSHRG